MQTIRFRARGRFYTELRDEVRTELARAGVDETGGTRIALKSAFILVLLACAYGKLVFATPSVLGWAFASFVLANAIVLVGFDVMHDAGHGSFSKSDRVNWIMARGLDLIGGNQTLWQRKHNIQHHTYTNLEPLDDDLDTNGLIRMHPDQPWRPHHRHQSLWALPAYSLLALHWVVSDFSEFFGRRVGRHELPKPTRLDTVVFVLGKVLWVSLAMVVPSLLHGVGLTLVTLLAVYLIVGFLLALVFQLAHVVEEAEFVTAGTNGVEDEWAVHQVKTTVNFATGNPLVTWYCGGLNFQIEHHLFPRVSHVRYPLIQPVVKRVCERHGVPYRENATLLGAVRSHVRWLAKLGAPATENAETDYAAVASGDGVVSARTASNA